MKKKLNVAVGLSGGVDSSVSAYLLLKQGYDVTGVHLVCWDEGPACRAREDRQDAIKVALKLGIPMEILDFQKEYKERVIDRFYSDYEKGLTPNPDVWCNSEIKFGMFLEWAMKNGFDYVATGHYARLFKPATKELSSATDNSASPAESDYLYTRQVCAEGDQAKLVCVNSQENMLSFGIRLCVPKDNHKDQTYFLHRLTQKELNHVLFPLGDLLKNEVRELAEKIDLPVAKKKDSQGICFIGDIDVHEFLKRRLKDQVGEVVDMEGKVIGSHKGVWFYTIGQRGGWEIAPEAQRQLSNNSHTLVTHSHTLPPLYVVNKDVKNNRLVVGFGAETYRERFEVGEISLVNQQIEDLRSAKQMLVRVRHGGKLLRAKLQITNNNLQSIMVELQEPERGIAPGQAAVFYRSQISNLKSQTECIGGGVIQ